MSTSTDRRVHRGASADRTRRPAGRGDRPARSPAGIAPGGPARIRVPELVVGVLLVAGGALAAVLWHTRATATTSIVVTARPVERGSVISAADLRAAHVAGDDVVFVTADRAAELVGMVTAVDLAAGVPITPDVVANEAPLADGEALSSIAIEPGWAPGDLAAGDRVRVVVVRPGDNGSPAASPYDTTVAVWSVAPPSDGSPDIVVTLRGPLGLATELATATSVQIARVAGPT